MLPRKICFVGLQLLLTTHIAQTFVLLTANMDDVKKLARKFLSGNFAEKLVEIISKAMAPNVSEENEANADEIQQISDTEVLDQTKSRQSSNLLMRTTASHNLYDSKEYARPSQHKVKNMGKVTSKYAITDLRDDGSKEFSLYRNPSDLALVKPKQPLIESHKHYSYLREKPQPHLASKKVWDPSKYELFNMDRKKPKISYQKSKVPEKSKNYNSEYSYANMMGRFTETRKPDDRYYPTSNYRDRRPKEEMQQHGNKERIRDFSREKESVRKIDFDKQKYNLIMDRKKANKNDALHMFVQNDGRLEELSPKRDTIGSFESKRDVGSFEKFTSKPRKPKDRSKDERYE